MYDVIPIGYLYHYDILIIQYVILNNQIGKKTYYLLKYKVFKIIHCFKHIYSNSIIRVYKLCILIYYISIIN